MPERQRQDDALIEGTLSESGSASGSAANARCVDQFNVLDDMELQRAYEIKAGIEEAENIRNLSDFEYVHLAIACPPQEDLDKILERVYLLQCFRDEYHLSDTVEDGMDLIREFLEQQKGFMLSLDFSPSQGSYIMVSDFAKFNPSAVQTPHDWKIRVAGLYYMFQCCCSRIRAIREGVVLISECEGMR